MNEIGNWVRRKRLELGLQQSEIAAMAGISQASVSQVEHGKAQPLIVTRVLEVLSRQRKRVMR